MGRMFFLIVSVFILNIPVPVAAHGTDYRLVEDARVVVAEFFYSDKEPMRYSDVLIFSPDNREVEYQNGRTDKEGRFAFCPDRSGEWQLTVNDGMGHAVNTTVQVSPETDNYSGGSPASTKQKAFLADSAVWIRIVFGLSVLLNVFWGLQTVVKRRYKNMKT